jgi:hypothetical protein
LDGRDSEHIDAEGGIRRTARCKNKEQWQKTGISMNKYNEKWVRIIIKNDSEV